MMRRRARFVAALLLYTFGIDTVAFGQVRPYPPMTSAPATGSARTVPGSRAEVTPTDTSLKPRGEAAAAAPARAVPAHAEATIPSPTTCADALRERRAPVLSVAKSQLWPPNHALVDVGLGVDVTPACAGRVTVSLSVFADEPDEDATGDGDQPGDARIEAPELFLRAERKGDADGRVYLLIATATDATGVAATGCAVVGVPHSRSKSALASLTSQMDAAGSYCASNGAAPGSFVPLTEGELLRGNRAPEVNAGPDQGVDYPGPARLDATVTDDGLPSGTLSFTWTKVEGPGEVTFADPRALDTTATFSQPGTHVLRLTADDSQLGASDDVIVVVSAANTAPLVDAGPDHRITLPVDTVTLAGQVSDDGRPSGVLTSTWSVVSGPAPVSFADPASPETTATFTASGEYLLRLAATDSQLETFDETRVTVDVEPPPVLSVADAQVVEGHEGTEGAVVPLTLSKPWPRPVSVDYMTFDGTATSGCDYRLRYGTLTVAPGETAGGILVPVVGEVTPEGEETVVVRLGNASEATLERTEAVLAIQNDDAVNQAPLPAFAPTPADGATGVVLPPVLSWSTSDPDGDAVTSDVYFGSSFSASGQAWARLCSATAGPAPRSGAVSAYDEASDRLMVLGGRLASGVEDATLWILEHATGTGGAPTWIPVPTTGGPAGLERASGHYDTATNRLIVFGGQTCEADACTASGDTWILTNANGLGDAPAWARVSTDGPARSGHTSAYDPATNRLVVFGGSQGGSDLGDVWVLSSANGLGGAPTWEALSPAGAPPTPRWGASGSYDPAANRLVLFGGRTSDGETFGDVWILKDASGLGTPEWVSLAIDSSSPARRWGHGTAYDPLSGHLLVFGGTTAGIETGVNFPLNDAWMLTGLDGPAPAWAPLSLGAGPQGRFEGVTAYASRANRLVVALGANNKLGSPADLWTMTDAMGSLPLLAGDLGEPSLPAADLIEGETYFWKVVTRDSRGAWRGSPVWRFTSNRPPLVDAGADETSRLPADTLTLAGTVSDDGLPSGRGLEVEWTAVSGPTPVVFGDARSALTTAAFGAAGVYVLRLVASDGVLSAADERTVTILPANTPPVVDAGPDQHLALPLTTTTLSGGVTDDGVPDGPVTSTWSLVSGPGPVSFTDAASPVTGASFEGGVGAYFLRLTATDGALESSDDVRVTVGSPSDLTVTRVDVSGVRYDPQTLAVSGLAKAQIANTGIGPAGHAFALAFFEDRNANATYEAGTDALLGQASLADLEAGAEATVQAALSGSVAFAGSPIHAFVDSGGVVAESDETNNYGAPEIVCVPGPTGTAPFNAVLKWAWTKTSTFPASVGVIDTPAVVDLDGDHTPEIVFVSYEGVAYNRDGHLRAVRGSDGTEVFTVTDPAYDLSAVDHLAVGDIDGDGKPEIVAHSEANRLVAFEHDGTPKWTGDAAGSGILGAAPSIADLDGDGVPEIVYANAVYDNAGKLRWARSDHHHAYGISIVADLDMDGLPEIVTGSVALRGSGAVYWLRTDLGVGYPAVGNFDDDPYPEIVYVANGKVYLLEHTGATRWGPVAIPDRGIGGPPTIADFDGDGRPEIGVANHTVYMVYGGDGSLRWTAPIYDSSSGITGAAAFDFDGDGAAEIVYSDELNLWVFRGSDGAALFKAPSNSVTRSEYPVVADVDGDGSAEVVSVANIGPNATRIQGVYVYEDPNGGWTRARSLWNQHSYHITNVDDDATIPRIEQNSWTIHNTYRSNAFGSTCPFAKPDVVPSFLRVTTVGAERRLIARVGNVGTTLASEGIPVSFYDGDPTLGGRFLGTASLGGPVLQTGAFEDVVLGLPVSVTTSRSVWVVADDRGGLHGIVPESDESNNALDSGLALLGSGGLADLYVSSVTADDSAVDGQTLAVSGSVSAEIRNQGEAAAGDFTTLFFEDRDGNGSFDSAADVVLGSTTLAFLPAGSRAIVGAPVSGTVLFAGSPVSVFVDSGAAVPEADEANNVGRSGGLCSLPPAQVTIAPVVERSWTVSAAIPGATNVQSAPAVADLDGDGKPEVVFSSFKTSSFSDGHLNALRGTDATTVVSVTDPAWDLAGGGSTAVGDIDGDGRPEIVAIHESRNRLVAFEHDGSFKWLSPVLPDTTQTGAPALADLEGDGAVEVVIGRSVLRGADGTLRWAGTAGVGHASGPISIVADLDGDGVAEVVAGNTAYRADGTIFWRNTAVSDGFAAVGNFDADPSPEVVVAWETVVWLLEHDGTLKWSTSLAGGSAGAGPPTLADVDGDGWPEIGVSTRLDYTLLDRLGNRVWTHGVRAWTGSVAGSAVAFDFDGDRTPELVLADQAGLHVWRGRDGSTLADLPIGTCGGALLPAVADVDGDGHAEIVTPVSRTCTDSALTAAAGLYVVGDAGNSWASARAIWNQHSYHVTNVDDDGTVPAPETASWLSAQNSYRAAPHAAGLVLAAPDVTVSLVRHAVAGSQIALTARVGNGGAGIAPKGIGVRFSDGDPAGGGALLGTTATSRDLAPGRYEDVTLLVAGSASTTSTVWAIVDAGGRECDTADNAHDSGLVLNETPEVDAGADRTIAALATTLAGSAEDDGLPVGVPVAYEWSLVSGPAGVTFGDPLAATTTVGFGQLGAHVFRLTVTDSVRTASDDVQITVVANQPPAVDAGPDRDVTSRTATLRGTVSDDGFPETASITSEWTQAGGPQSATISTPQALQTSVAFPVPGDYVFQLSASDTELAATDTVTLRVAFVNRAPVVEAGADQTITLPETTAGLDATVTDDGLPLGAGLTFAWSRLFGPGPVTFGTPAAEDTTVTVSAPGVYTFRLVARDTDLAGSDTVTLTVRPAAAEGNPPTVAPIGSPADGTAVTGPTPIVGTVSGDTLASWVAEHRSTSETAWTRFAEGTTSVTNGTLGTFDPTLLLNGTYEIRVLATDTAGRSAAQSLTLVVKGNQKVGHFSLAFVDLELPVAGVPIRVTRTYDSRDVRKGDFGPGWRLDVSSVRVGKSRTLGLDWSGVSSGGGFPSYCLPETKPHVVTVTEPGGQVSEFEMVLSPRCQAFVPPDMVSVGFRPRPGTHGSLVPVGSDEAWVVSSWNGSAELYDSRTYALYDPSAFEYTSPEGRTMTIHEKEGLRRFSDPNANTLSISAGGITYTNPAAAGSTLGIVFTRDAQGRIARITDPAGLSLSYGYDGNGDLASYTDRDDAKTSFTYDADFPHHLRDIEDALGRTPIRNEYYPDGRIKSHTDAFGKTITYTHDLSAREETITDRDGKLRLLGYDLRGNVVREVDPDGKQILRSFDGRDNRLSETEPHDLSNATPPTTTYTYDGRDNLTSVTDPKGNRTEHTYDARRQVLTSKDPRGHVTTNTYDEKGNLTSTQDAAGTLTAYSYESRGKLLSQTVVVNGVPHVTRSEYDVVGFLAKDIDANGHETSYTHNRRTGSRLSETRTRTLPDGSTETLTTRFEYDGGGRLTKTIDPDGTSTRTVYDALGRQLETYDKLGRKTAYTYDEMGRLTKTTFPDDTPDPSDNPTEESTYDAEGRRLTSRDRAGRVTSYEYDPNGRLTFTRFPAAEGEPQPFTENRYDDAGRLVQTIDARLKSTFYTYDEAGRRTSVKDPLNNETLFGYDANGNQTSLRDPKGNTTTYEYDELNRRTKTVFPDTTFTETGYDSLGRRIVETDQAGKTTRFQYDKVGRLTKVTDPLSGETPYGHDEVGNRTSQTDANNHTTRFEYDRLGRETARILSGNARETKEHDAAGNLVLATDFAGRTTTFAYDAGNRLLSRTYENPAENVSFTYTATGRLETATSVRGTTTYDYDLRDRLREILDPTGARIDLAWDENGNRVTLTAVPLDGPAIVATMTYDEANRLDLVTDTLGRSYDLGYDANGNRTSLDHPNGAATTYSYDLLNRLTSLTTVSAVGTVQAYSLVLGPSGNRTSITEHGSRTRDFSYDGLYRLIQEKVTGAAGLIRQEDLTYDAVGNRLTRTFTDAAGTATTTTYGYDERDRLLSELTSGALTSYTWDANGNVVTKSGEASYFWNTDKRLVRVEKADGTLVEHAYDPFGNRVQTKVTKPGQPTETTNFLVDTSRSLSHVVADLDEAGRVKAYYLRADDELIAILRPDGAGGYTSRNVHSDFIGSIRALTDDTGAASDTWEYDAWGNQLSHVGTDPQPYAFAGEPRDSETLWQYHRARWLQPSSGRFASVDPFEGWPTEPVTFQPYLYASADPVGKRDPSGQFTIGTQVTTTSGIQAITASQMSQSVVALAIKRLLVGVVLVNAVGAGIVGPVGVLEEIRRRGVPQDLYAFGNKTLPRAPRLSDFDLTGPGFVGPEAPPNPKGASTFADPNVAPAKGHYHRIPRGILLPPGLAVIADGAEMGGLHAPTHHTIYPTVRMGYSAFVALFLGLPWEYAGFKPN